MKKLGVIFIALLLCGFMYTEEMINLFSGETIQWKTVLKTVVKNEFAFIFIEDDDYIFAINEPMGNVYYVFNKANYNEMMLAIDKFFEWEKKAQAQNITINKKIKDISAIVIWEYGNEKHYDPYCQFKIGFTSTANGNSYLVFSSEKYSSFENQFVSGVLSDPYCFNNELVRKIKKAMSLDNIQKKLKEAQEQKAKEDQFK